MGKIERIIKDLYNFSDRVNNIDIRVYALMLMDKIAYKFDDEEFTESWMILGVPNGAIIQDYIDIAENNELYEDISGLFTRLLHGAVKEGGLYNATPIEYSFSRLLEPEIENYIPEN